MSPALRGLAPRQGIECLLVKIGSTRPLEEPRRGLQASKSGTLVLRTPTVSPGPKACSYLASRRSEGASAERHEPHQPAALDAAWRLIGRRRLRFPTLPHYAPG